MPTAVHEAGHAVMMLCLDCSVDSIELGERPHEGLTEGSSPNYADQASTRRRVSKLRDLGAILSAGYCAVEILLGEDEAQKQRRLEPKDNLQSDSNRTQEVANQIAELTGQTSEEVRCEIEAEAYEILTHESVRAAPERLALRLATAPTAPTLSKHAILEAYNGT